MRFSRKHKFVLISNWRCGCSTVADLFAPYSEFDYKHSSKCQDLLGIPYGKVVHWPAKRVRALFKKNGLNWDKYIKITTIRNPWARIVSLFHYKFGRKNGVKNAKKRFTEFVINELPRWQKGIRNRWKSYEMIHDQRGRKIVDYVVRIEKLEKDLKPIIEKHFPHFQIDYGTRRNTTNHDHYSYYYNSRTKKIVADMFAWDIKKYKYKFEKPPQPIQEEIQKEIPIYPNSSSEEPKINNETSTQNSSSKKHGGPADGTTYFASTVLTS